MTKLAERPEGLGLTRLRIGDAELFVFDHPVKSTADPSVAGQLTETQRAVVLLALEGYSNRDIALRRGIAEGTVAKHLAAAYRRLGVGSKSELAALIGSRDAPMPATPRPD